MMEIKYDKQLLRKRAIALVDSIGGALMVGNRAGAIKLAEATLSGQALSASEKRLCQAAPLREASSQDAIWATARNLFGDESHGNMWRSIVGRLVKECGAERALEILGIAKTRVDPKAWLAAAMKAGFRGPLWKLSDEDLHKAAAEYRIRTSGRDRKEIERDIEKATRLDTTGVDVEDVGETLGAQALR